MVAALNDIRHTRRFTLVNRHGLDKEALRTAQSIIQGRVDRFVELGDGIRMAILDIAPFDDLRATPDSRPPHVISHQLNHIGMPHALARCKVRRLRVNVKTSVFDRLDIRIAYLGQRDRPQRTLLGTPQKRHARLFEQIVNHTG